MIEESYKESFSQYEEMLAKYKETKNIHFLRQAFIFAVSHWAFAFPSEVNDNNVMSNKHFDYVSKIGMLVGIETDLDCDISDYFEAEIESLTTADELFDYFCNKHKMER